ncbi:MAG TPA: hypothetical protein VFP19_00605, partial [Candidatus Limnocylindrales bacterium]|nr:hypothetical protein [Candidatus Limnocylindrales bacterium]
MLEPRSRWVFPTRLDVDPTLLAAGRDLGLSERIVGLLARRGVGDAAGLRAFLGDPVASLNDPRSLPDAEAFEARVRLARDRDETVMVFGDFDADGITGLTILVIALRRFGVSTVPYVPSRLDEGHGLSLAAVEAAVTAGATVIVTVDTGTSSV